MKKLFGKKVKSFTLYKMPVGKKRKKMTFGMIHIENYEYRIKIKEGKFFFLNDLGQIAGMVLKSNPAYTRIKSSIQIYFKTYRKNNLRIRS